MKVNVQLITASSLPDDAASDEFSHWYDRESTWAVYFLGNEMCRVKVPNAHQDTEENLIEEYTEKVAEVLGDLIRALPDQTYSAGKIIREKEAD